MANLRLQMTVLEEEHPLLFAYLHSTENKHLRTRMLKTAAEQFLTSLNSEETVTGSLDKTKVHSHLETKSIPNHMGKSQLVQQKDTNKTTDVSPPRLKIGINASDNLDTTSMEKWG
ncbi:hypothetical protein AAKU64_004394 [Undibacterium sp. GrIS 1.8]|uniref:hypothetical protein n=1 Tax=Undibacterium sp. GrIS 1.8 TaxID=3143934 RepID=UPI0033937364